MKVKVGEILKDEVKNIPGLRYPYKIIVNNKSQYSQNQKIENSLLLIHCFTIINNIQTRQNSTKSINRSQFLSKTVYGQGDINFRNSAISKQPIRKYSMSFDKNKLKNQLPLIKDNIPIKRNISLNIKRLPKKINSDGKNKIDSDNKKSFQKDINNSINISNFTNQCNKRGATPKMKLMKNKRNNNLFNNYMKSINNTNNKYQLRYEKKFKLINQVINKMKKPLFINNNGYK